VAERAPLASTVVPRPGSGRSDSLPARNRRTAAGLVVWIVGLMLVSALVAWLRN
jgi:hypothetical protein